MAFLTYEIPPVMGGVSRLCSFVLSELEKKGVDIDLISFVNRRVPEKRGQREWKSLDVLNRGNYEVVLSGIVYPEGVVASFSTVPKKVILAHGLELFPHTDWKKRGLSRWLKDRALKSADLVISNSHYTKEYVEKEYNLNNVRAVPLGVDPQEFSPVSKLEGRQFFQVPEGKFVIGTLARIYHYKGYKTVFEALLQMPKEERDNVQYLIGGTGPDKEAIEELANSMGLRGFVTFVGKVPEGKLCHFYSACDLFVMCSEENLEKQTVEGFGLVFLEAQACGVPVLGTRSGGIPDAIDENQGGFLVDQGNSQSVSQILSHLMSNPRLVSTLGEKGRHRCLNSMSWDHYGDKLFQALKDENIL